MGRGVSLFGKSVSSLMLLLLFAGMLASAFTVTHSSAGVLDSMWVSPSMINYSASKASVGTLFNVTVWANMQNGTYDWQVNMNFDASVFQEVACGYTDGTTSAYFFGHTTVPITPFVNNALGTILFGESLIGLTDYAPEENASLMYAEFNITKMPTTTTPSYTGVFDINATGSRGTFFDDFNGNNIVLAANLYDATYTLTYSAPGLLDSMWVSPSTIAYSTDNASVGTLFNVTVWAYMQNGTFDWQVTMKFDSSVFQEVKVGYTDGATSAYFAGHVTVPVYPVVDNVGGSILFAESLIGEKVYAPEENASLMYAEFNITKMPTTTTPSYTGVFDINATGTTGTFFDDFNGNNIVLAANLYDANFTLSHVPVPTISSLTQVPNVISVNDSEAVAASANVTDNSGTGIANVTLVYSLEGWTVNSTAAMTLNSRTRLYDGTIPGFLSGTIVYYVIQAYDNNGGFTETPPETYTVLSKAAAQALVQVTKITSNTTWVYQGQVVNVNVTVSNVGDPPENVWVTLYYNMTAGKSIGAYPVYLDIEQNYTFLFMWNTAGIPCLNYTLTAVATIPTGSNTFIDGSITIRLVGDVNGDGRVDLKDIALVVRAFGSTTTRPNWNPAADLNGDGIVNMQDVAIVARQFGQHYP
jgi:uncharacterized protein (DUF2141 family)